MKVIYDKSFLKQAKILPQKTSAKLADLIILLKDSPFHNLLHTRPLAGKLEGFFSFRITRDWRVIFLFLDQTTIHLITVKHRKDIYR